MAAGTDRLAQVFLWKQGDAPDVDYAKEFLRAAIPDASRAIAHDASLLRIFAIEGLWPSDPWLYAISDMNKTPAPIGTRWTDPANYDLGGWHGKDLRTGENLFVVSAYSRPKQLIVSNFRQEEELTPTPSVAQTPYYPQYPTGPVAWPPTSDSGGAETTEETIQTSGVPQYMSRYSPLETGPFAGGGTIDGNIESLESAIRAALLDSYAPFYVGFGPRLIAGLIDLFFTMIFPFVAIVALILKGQSAATFAQYALVACLALVVFAVYHVVQVGLWGQTLGKVLVGIKIAAPDGGVPGFGRAFLRILGYGFSILPAGWGFVRIATDPRRQALHDRIAETYVIPESLTGPTPQGMPGYAVALPIGEQSQAPVIGMAALASSQDLHTGLMATVPQLPEHSENISETGLPSLLKWSNPETSTVPAQILAGIATPVVPVAKEKKPIVEKARVLFKSGLTALEKGNIPAVRGYKVDPQLARVAASLIKDALDLVPNSVAYRYFYAVALRYAEGIEPALREFRRVLELDPGHFEAQQQVTYGARWHDAFSYPVWVAPAPIEIGKTLPPAVSALLPEGDAPVTRMVLLREGGLKRGAFLSRTPLSAWATPPSLDMRASLHVTLSNTPYGPILALYVVMEDGIHNPYIGEAFLNPREATQNTEDACHLGQHMLEQLTRQDRTYFIFADEQNRLLLSRKVNFNTRVQISITRCLYEVQSLPPETMGSQQFVLAAQWHMEHNSLDQVKEQVFSGNDN